MKKKVYIIFMSLVLFLSCTSNAPLSFKGIYLGCPQNEIEKIVSQDKSIRNFHASDSESSFSELQFYHFDTFIIGDNDERINGNCMVVAENQKVISITLNVDLNYAKDDAIKYLPNIYNLYKDKYGKAKKEGNNYIWKWDNQSLTIECKTRDKTWRKHIASHGIDVENLDSYIKEKMDGPNEIKIEYRAILQDEIEATRKVEEQNRIEQKKMKEREEEKKHAIKKMKKKQDI